MGLIVGLDVEVDEQLFWLDLNIRQYNHSQSSFYMLKNHNIACDRKTYSTIATKQFMQIASNEMVQNLFCVTRWVRHGF